MTTPQSLQFLHLQWSKTTAQQKDAFIASIGVPAITPVNKHFVEREFNRLAKLQKQSVR